MRLLRRVAEVLDNSAVPHALIGAVALSLHGVSRATGDADLLTMERRTLREDFWATITADGAVRLRVIIGDSEDPLAGSARLTGEREIVDVVVGRFAWQEEIIAAAEVMTVEDVGLKVARPAGLVLLKLFAGGPKDAWDIRSLFEFHPAVDQILPEVEAVVQRLPADARRLWKQLRAERP